MPPARPGGRDHRTYTAGLFCGTVLTYEAPEFVPGVGEVVPCRRHGFCSVTAREGSDGRGAGNDARARRRRSPAELLAFLSTRPATSVRALRAQRFTLRVVAAAEKEGLVDVDLVSGRVALRGGAGASTPGRPQAVDTLPGIRRGSTASWSARLRRDAVV